MRHRSLVVLVVALLCVTAGAGLATAREPDASSASSASSIRKVLPGRQVEVRAGRSTNKPAPILAASTTRTSSGQASLGPATADIQVTYTGFSPAAQTAFEAAVQIWETRIVSTQVIHVNATWTALGNGILGQAGPENFILFDDDFLYPAALAEAVCSCEAPNQPFEIGADFSSAFSNWYLGTDGNAPAGTYDFMTVVMHELGHGLGFISSFGIQMNKGYWGWPEPPSLTAPYYALPYDFHEFSAATGGYRFMNQYPDSSLLYSNLKTDLTDGSVFFNGPNVQAAIGGRAKLYAPSRWSNGSSNSHFDEVAFPTGTQNALMTPQLAGGEVIHEPGPLTLALFRDIGWKTSSPPATPPTVSLNLPTLTGSATVAVSMSESDPSGTGIAGWFLSTSSSDPAAGDPGWQSPEPTTFTLPGGDGNKTVYAWVKNNAGLVSEASSDTTLLDTTNPTATVSVPATTTVQQIAITLGGNDSGGSGINGWFVSESSTPPALNNPGWQSVKPTTFTLSTGYGVKTVYAWSRDLAGHRSSAASANVELLDVVPPTVSAPRADFVSPQTIGSTALVRVSWPAATDPSGIASYQVQYKRNTGAWTPITLNTPTQTSVNIALTHAADYRFRVAATDTEGNTSLFAASVLRRLIRPQETSLAIAYSGSWKRVALSGASGGYVQRSVTSGNTATLTFTGNSVAFVTARGANRGIAEIRLDGVLVDTIDLYSATTLTKRLVWASTGLGAGTHTVQIRVTGTKNAASTGFRLDVDTFLAWQ